MDSRNGGILCVALFSALMIWTHCPAIEPNIGASARAIAELAGVQQMLELNVRVIDPDGKPVAKTKITPWALRSSQGHGLWMENDERAGVGPKEIFSDVDGRATVLYPRYRDVKECVRTIAVSLFADHPDFAFGENLHIDVPLETKEPYEIKLGRGVPLEIRSLIDGQPAALDDLYAIWSDGRSWQPGVAPEKLAEGILRIPALSEGANSVLIVKLEGGRATHFSRIVDLELTAGEVKQIDVELKPALRVEGALSENVPRPVRMGRIKAFTLSPAKAAHGNRVTWFTWVPIQPDGTFAIDWPADEQIQLIALCDGYHATSGSAPDAVQDPPDPKTDSFNRPQVFAPESGKKIELAMTRLVPCAVRAVDEDRHPVAGVRVVSWPNVGWWNEGSQIYGEPLVRGEQLLRDRAYEDAIHEKMPVPFEGETDAEGKAMLQIPAGDGRLAVTSEVYELPVFLGRRDIRIELVPGKTTAATLRLQPRGTDKLGDWDKLAGVVFGCSTREGRRICALPGVQAKMDEFTKRFREADDQRDPRLLSEAYAAVAEAFDGVGDKAEAAKWRQKSAEQAAKIEAPEGN